MQRREKELGGTRERVCVAILLVGAMLCSGCNGQAVPGTNWLQGLSQSIEALNRNIQQNVQQVNQRVQETVRSNLEQVDQLRENLNEGSGPGNVQIIGGNNNLFVSGQDGTKIVYSGRTSDGKPFVRETTDKVVGDTLRHVDKIYDPATKVSRVHGYTLDLKDPNAKPVPINDDA
ncbi:uncharacterized protein LOC114880677 [Osmia bicornis bicornis]|uniref:uncharacterized protein LOC114880677 n=1 Tax=Osmia bicornis bicornis TaxID=1437191 RepID=UPI0010F73FB1|nr:uncharacterized protein LOC114880677 [Osmia bicornis bicornis]